MLVHRDYTDRFIERADSDGESSNASMTATDCICAEPTSVPHQSHVLPSGNSMTSADLPTVVHSLSENVPINAHTAFSLNISTNIVTSCSDTVQPVISAAIAGEKRSHDQLSAEDLITNNRAGVRQPQSPVKKLCMDLSTSEHTNASALPLTDGTSSVKVANVM